MRTYSSAVSAETKGPHSHTFAPCGCKACAGSTRQPESERTDIRGLGGTGLAHDFSSVPATGAQYQTLVSSKDDMRPEFFGLAVPRLTPIYARGIGGSSPTMPSAGEEDVFQPEGGAGSGSAPAPAAPESDSCDVPRSMNKIVSGAFLGGLTMDSYFPDFSGRGMWAHAGTGGPFDTGSQAGGNAQLLGVIPSPCVPSRFTLEQTANPVRFRIGGVPHPLEGTTFDDIGRSGFNFSIPPRRQEFLGGGDAPLGYIISMADPPSVGHGVGRPDVERDTNFVSSLAGPGGRKSVSWSQSVRVAGNRVTTNTLT